MAYISFPTVYLNILVFWKTTTFYQISYFLYTDWITQTKKEFYLQFDEKKHGKDILVLTFFVT